MTIHISAPRQAQQILTLFRAMPAVEKRQVLEMLKEELAT